MPAYQVSRTGAGESLKDGARGGTEGRSAARRALVVCQVAIAVVLIVAAGLLAKSFARVVGTPSGLDPGGVLTLRVSVPASRYPGRQEVSGFFDRALERIRSLPGVRVAGAGSGLPLSVASGDWGFDIEGRPKVNGRRPGAADWFVVTPGYFEALGIAPVRGRLPAASDTEDAPPVVFINETTARTLFPDADPLGKRVRFGGSTYEQQPWRTIAGVVGDVRTRGLDQPLRTEVFFPHRQFLHFSPGAQARAMTITIKTSGAAPTSLTSAVRAELRGIDAEVAAADVRDMDTVVSGSVADRRMQMVLVAAFGGLALALAAVGLYGVMAFHVVQRTREMGVRLALGASRADVLGLVVGQGMRLVAVGLALGTVAAFAATRPMADLLHDVSPRDTAVFALAPILLAAVGLLACYIPARRATRVDPVVALRSE
jgi:putative ABC transport system permease protein